MKPNRNLLFDIRHQIFNGDCTFVLQKRETSTLIEMDVHIGKKTHSCQVLLQFAGKKLDILSNEKYDAFDKQLREAAENLKKEIPKFGKTKPSA